LTDSHASLQVIRGLSIGKIIPLKKALMRFGHNGAGIIVITKRKDGYHVTSLENIGIITLNSKPMANNSFKLHHGDVLVVDNTTMQFFLS
jgi:hypothetical protein